MTQLTRSKFEFLEALDDYIEASTRYAIESAFGRDNLSESITKTRCREQLEKALEAL